MPNPKLGLKPCITQAGQATKAPYPAPFTVPTTIFSLERNVDTGLNNVVVFANRHNGRRIVDYAISATKAYTGRYVVDKVYCTAKPSALVVAVRSGLVNARGDKLPMFSYRMLETKRHMALYASAIRMERCASRRVGIFPFFELIEHSCCGKHKEMVGIYQSVARL